MRITIKMSTIITRQDQANGRHAYLITGTVNAETYNAYPVIAASKVTYTHASLTTLTDDTEVLAFHKTPAAAAKGNPQIARKYHAGVTVIEITAENARSFADKLNAPAKGDER
jgi:hypothetical protein